VLQTAALDEEEKSAGSERRVLLSRESGSAPVVMPQGELARHPCAVARDVSGTDSPQEDARVARPAATRVVRPPGSEHSHRAGTRPSGKSRGGQSRARGHPNA
jgi:hypothetical protein